MEEKINHKLNGENPGPLHQNPGHLGPKKNTLLTLRSNSVPGSSRLDVSFSISSSETSICYWTLGKLGLRPVQSGKKKGKGKKKKKSLTLVKD